MFVFKEWLFAWEEYLLLRFTIMEWIREQTIIMKRTRDLEAAETLTEVEKLQDELERFKSEELAPKEVCVYSDVISCCYISLKSKPALRYKF